MLQPITPTPPHATLPTNATSALIDESAQHITPPPSSQLPRSLHGKSRTPTPTVSHISTPPPTIENMTTHDGTAFAHDGPPGDEDVRNATSEELRVHLANSLAALSAAKMSAAHYQLQYRMLAQENTAVLERIDVEARLSHEEDKIIRKSEQAKAAANSIEASPAIPDGMIPVQKDLYEHMRRELQHFAALTQALEYERVQQNSIIADQESQIASLSDRVSLMRDRIRESREQIQRYRMFENGPDAKPRSQYSVTQRRPRAESNQQPFAALLQASEMASLAATRIEPSRRGHVRGSMSMPSAPTTPQRSSKQRSLFYTPTPVRVGSRVPATAPQVRSRALQTPEDRAHHDVSLAAGSVSEGTVSASDEDDDSEAETEILEDNEVDESRASRTASQMLRTSQEEQNSKRDGFKGRGLLNFRPTATKQTTLFGAVRKRNIDREEVEPERKRVKIGEGVGLGINGLKG